MTQGSGTVCVVVVVAAPPPHPPLGVRSRVWLGDRRCSQSGSAAVVMSSVARALPSGREVANSAEGAAVTGLASSIAAAATAAAPAALLGPVAAVTTAERRLPLCCRWAGAAVPAAERESAMGDILGASKRLGWCCKKRSGWGGCCEWNVVALVWLYLCCASGAGLPAFVGVRKLFFLGGRGVLHPRVCDTICG